MKMTRRRAAITSAAVVALILTIGDVNRLSVAGTRDTVAAGVQGFGARASASVAQWQPASGYVPTSYPVSGSWEQMASALGR